MEDVKRPFEATGEAIDKAWKKIFKKKVKILCFGTPFAKTLDRVSLVVNNRVKNQQGTFAGR